MRRLACLLSLLFVAACSGQSAPSNVADIPSLQVIDQTPGSGTAASTGDTVSVHYTGWLYDAQAGDHHGRQFDSSREHGSPITFKLGVGQVIAGWDQGVVGMRVGGKRELLIPSSLGYGTRGAGGDIPPNAALVFEVELVRVK